MAFDLNNFMDALASFIANATSLNYDGDGPRAIWRNQADEASAAVPYSILRCFGGVIPYVPLPTPSIQCETIGTNDAAIEQANKLYSALCDADGRPLRMQQIGVGYRVNAILGLGVPGLVGRDGNERARVVFNFNAEVCPFPLEPPF